MTYLFSQLEPRFLEAQDLPCNTIALDITKSIDDRHGTAPYDASITPLHIMAYTQRAWVINPDNAKDAALILAVYSGNHDYRLIVGAFIFGRQDSSSGSDCFVPSPYKEISPQRCIFLAEPAPEQIWNRYVGHYMPPRRQGEENPVQYFNFTHY